ncbi:MAG: NAD(P)-dependent oxidoreductase [Paracoccaceae bacterium]
MNQRQRKMVALLGKMPADVQTALGDDFDLVDAAKVQVLAQAEQQAISHGVTSAMGGVDQQMLKALPALTTIASVGAGLDKFDLAGLAAQGIDVTPTPHVMVEDTAEYAVGLIFAVLRNIVSNDRFVRSGRWAEARAPFGARVSERKVGILGLGRIGGRVASKLDALGCAISYAGRNAKDVPWPFVPDIADLAASVDVLVLTCAGGAATQGIVNAEVLQRLGPQGVLINVSRGSVVDEAALITALVQDQIAGAALDVFEDEPMPNPKFFDAPTCILSPHAAVYTRENRRDLIAEIKRLLSDNVQ